MPPPRAPSKRPAARPRTASGRGPGAAARDAPAPAAETGTAVPRRRRGGDRPQGEPGSRRSPRDGGGESYWIYGHHAVEAALANPSRQVLRLLVAARAAGSLPASPRVQAEAIEPQALSQRLPQGAVHQGLAALVTPLAMPPLRDWLAGPGAGSRLLVLLDQVTDPQNVGAILRSATAFGAGAVVTTAAHAPEESGALAKAASGALDMTPYLREPNLARVLEVLADAGFWRVALDTDGTETLADAVPRDRRVALVLGAEGSGLRRLTRERCDIIARLPIRPEIGSLNVAQAATAALYECARTSSD